MCADPKRGQPADWTTSWIDGGRYPREKPNPRYPTGVDLDCSDGAEETCTAKLVCPTPRCGKWVVRCRRCGTTAIATTAGRPDDPRSLTLACKEKLQ